MYISIHNHFFAHFCTSCIICIWWLYHRVRCTYYLIFFLNICSVLKVMCSIDDLFELPAPAALKRGMNRGKWPFKHGHFVAWTGWFGCGTG